MKKVLFFLTLFTWGCVFSVQATEGSVGEGNAQLQLIPTNPLPPEVFLKILSFLSDLRNDGQWRSTCKWVNEWTLKQSEVQETSYTSQLQKLKDTVRQEKESKIHDYLLLCKEFLRHLQGWHEDLQKSLAPFQGSEEEKDKQSREEIQGRLHKVTQILLIRMDEAYHAPEKPFQEGERFTELEKKDYEEALKLLETFPDLLKPFNLEDWLKTFLELRFQEVQIQLKDSLYQGLDCPEENMEAVEDFVEPLQELAESFLKLSQDPALNPPSPLDSLKAYVKAHALKMAGIFMSQIGFPSAVEKYERFKEDLRYPSQVAEFYQQAAKLCKEKDLFPKKQECLKAALEIQILGNDFEKQYTMETLFSRKRVKGRRGFLGSRTRNNPGSDLKVPSQGNFAS